MNFYELRQHIEAVNRSVQELEDIQEEDDENNYSMESVNIFALYHIVQDLATVVHELEVEINKELMLSLSRLVKRAGK